MNEGTLEPIPNLHEDCYGNLHKLPTLEKDQEKLNAGLEDQRQATLHSTNLMVHFKTFGYGTESIVSHFELIEYFREEY
jgi:hypothetical protein